MPGSILEQLKSYTTVVADSGDFNQIKKFKPQDSTTNPSLIGAAAAMPEYQDVVKATLAAAKKEAGAGADAPKTLSFAVDRLAVEFGRRILEIVPGRVSTEVDARISYDVDKSIERARRIIGLYAEAGVKKERVLVKLASTWEGIRAAEQLEREGIHCNLTLLFGFHQAVACAEAGVTLISPFVGRILDWHLKSTGKTSFPPPEDPGVVSVTAIYDYYKRHGYQTEVMGASFRNTGEITELAGCDLLTIAPKLLAELDAMQGDLPRKLDPKLSAARGKDKITIDEPTFRRMHAADQMATDKLAEGVAGFSKDLEKLEALLTTQL